MKILAVDDSPDSLLLIKHFLYKGGYTDVYEAASAEEAFEILGLNNAKASTKVTWEIDLILMDIVMPEMDGIEACREIKANEHLKDIPLIMLTSKDEEDTLEAAFEAGAMDYITKDTGKTVLLARVRSALSLKSERDQRKAREKELLETTRLLEEANLKLQEQSFLDGLTGIANRRRFDDAIKMEWKRSRRNETPLSLVMLDIDQFKFYNDNYGHLAGDDCLRKVAQLIQEVLKRPADLATRYGGEEFAVLLPETDGDGALNIAEEMRRNVERAKLPHEYSTVHDRVTISLGVCTVIPEQKEASNHLIKCADEALYDAKQNGRNRVSKGESLNL